MDKLGVVLTLSFKSAYHSTGDKLSLEVDKVLHTDKSENIVIPATLLKGNLRHQIELALKTFGLDVCESRNPKNMCDKCVVCKIFGSPKNKSRLFFDDVKLDPNKTQVQKQFGIAIDRKSKTAKEPHLFSTEIAFYERETTANIDGLFNSHSEAIRAAALIFLGSRLTFSIGAQKSRGLGWLECKKMETFINGEAIPEREIKQHIREWIR